MAGQNMPLNNPEPIIRIFAMSLRRGMFLQTHAAALVLRHLHSHGNKKITRVRVKSAQIQRLL